MKLIIGEHEADILYAVGRIEPIEGAQRKIVEIVSAKPLPVEVLEAITEGFRTEDGGGYGADYPAYKEVVRHSTWIAEVDANAVIVKEKNTIIAEKEATIAEKETVIQAVTAEKEEAETEVATVRSSINMVLFDRRDDILVELLELMEEWNENGTYIKGDNRKWNGSPYTAIQPSSPNGDMNWAPDKAAALWSIYHAKSFKHALPWVAPTH